MATTDFETLKEHFNDVLHVNHVFQTQSIRKLPSLLQERGLIFVTGDVGMGKSVLMHLAHHEHAAQHKTLFLARPLENAYELLKTLYITLNPDKTTVPEEELLGIFCRQYNGKPLYIFIEAFELMDYEQMKLVMRLKQCPALHFIVSLNTKEAKKLTNNRHFKVVPDAIYPALPLSPDEVLSYITTIFLRAQHKDIAGLFNKEVSLVIAKHTKGNLSLINAFMRSLLTLFQQHQRQRLPLPKLSCLFLSKVALTMGLIQKRTFQLKCYANETFKYIAKVESTVELALIGALYLFLFSHTPHLHAQYDATVSINPALKMPSSLPQANAFMNLPEVVAATMPKYDTVRLKIAL